MWFCERCNNKLHAEYFQLENIETQLAPVFERFFADERLRTCGRCGAVLPRA
jgi:3-hydroxyanthranilate 3,4-dioxygenase